jgi:hypothetical protein
MDSINLVDHKKFKQNVVVSGVISAQLADSAGEVLNVKNADISSLNDGTGFINCEHKNPQDIDSAKDSNFAGFNTIVGRVISAKKIFGPEDCDDKYQKAAWNDLKVPILWATMEFWDDIEAHDNARAVASLIRLSFKHNFEPMVSFSVEGSVLERDGIELKHTVIRGIAATLKPANKVAGIKQLVQDNFDYDMQKSESTDLKVLSKPIELRQCNIILPQNKLKQAISNLKKTLDAGSMNAAPGSLTQGGALQSGPSDLDKVMSVVGNKPLNRKTIKKAMPHAQDDQIDKLIEILKKKRLEKTEDQYNQIFRKLFNK